MNTPSRNTKANTASAPLVVLEGIDGSGKGTQAARLVERLRSRNLSATLFSFPRYDKTFFGARIGEFLNGKFGTLDELHPFLISLLYAGDRFESRNELEAARREADIVVLDRYIASNIAHQTAKLPASERGQLTEWIQHIEHDLFGMPRAAATILLDTPVEVSQNLIARKQERSYTDQIADLQEADVPYLAKVREVYLSLAAADPTWTVVPVTSDGGIRTIEEISDDVLQIVLRVLK